MQEATMCFSKLEKPGKDEPIIQVRHWMVKNQYCPDCDRKRTTVCKDPNCNRTKTH